MGERLTRRGGRRGRKHRAETVREAEIIEKAEPAFAVYSHSAQLYDPTYWESERQHGSVYKDSIWAFVTIRAIATVGATVRWALMRKTPGTGPDEEVAEHPLLDLIERPNPHTSRFDLLEEIFWQYLLEGTSYVEMVAHDPVLPDINRKYLPIGLYALKSAFVDPLPDPKTRVKGYVYSPNGENIVYKPWEIIQIRAYNPENDLEGYTAYDTAQSAIEVDRDTQLYSRNFFKRGAFPSAALETDRILPKSIQTRVKSEWKNQFGLRRNAHEVALLMAGLKYKPIAFTFRDMDFERLRKLAREEILSAGDVPPIVVGLTEGSSWANAHQQMSDFVTHTIGPILIKIIDRFNLDLVARFDDSLYFKPDYVSYLKSPEQDEANERRARALWKDGLVTRNEARGMAGFGPANEDGDVFIDALRDLRNTGSTIRPTSSGSQDRDGEERDPGTLPDSPDRAREIEVRPRNRLDRVVTEELRENQMILRNSVRKLRERYRIDLLTCITDMFAAQSRHCMAKLASESNGFCTIEKTAPAELTGFLTNVSMEFTNSFVGLLMPLAKEASELVISTLLGYETVPDSDLYDAVANAVTLMFSQVNETTGLRLAKELEGHSERLTKGEAERIIISVFEDSIVDKHRANTTVETEMTRAISFGMQKALDMNGWMAKTWLCESGNSRDGHAHADGQTVPTQEPFLVGGEALMYPGDPEGSPNNVCGCQCMIVPGAPSALHASVGKDAKTPIQKPYSGAGDSSLPSDIKSLPKKRREIFVSVFNRVLRETGDEGKAFAQARAAAKRGLKKESVVDPNGQDLEE